MNGHEAPSLVAAENWNAFQERADRAPAPGPSLKGDWNKAADRVEGALCRAAADAQLNVPDDPTWPTFLHLAGCLVAAELKGQ